MRKHKLLMTKKIILAIILCASTAYSFSQQKLNEGYVILKTYNNNSKLDTSITVTYFKDSRQRTESYNNVSGKTIQISDKKTKELLTLIDHPSFGKIYHTAKMIWDEAEKEKIEVIKGDKTRKILGYDCQQYIVKSNDTTSFEVYTTEEINSSFDTNTSDLFKGKIKGFILYTKVTKETLEDTIEMVAEVVEIVKESIADEKFSLLPPKGYIDANQH